MNKNVLPNYEIHQDTVALIPAYHPDYDTIVIERYQRLCVKKTPLQLIKLASIEGGADYDGRRKSVIHKTGAKHKVPIPVNPNEQIYAFPTHSASQHKCAWIFYYHVKTIKPSNKKLNHSIITFNNGTTLPLDVSFTSLRRQMKRTSYCIVRFSKRSPFDDDSFIG
ncbi:competence protein [bacterium LRH843]|nr:competence protein [bacterium LRH843]